MNMKKRTIRFLWEYENCRKSIVPFHKTIVSLLMAKKSELWVNRKNALVAQFPRPISFLNPR